MSCARSCVCGLLLALCGALGWVALLQYSALFSGVRHGLRIFP